MARPPSEHPTDAELEILKVLWDAGPSELGPIVSALNRDRSVADDDGGDHAEGDGAEGLGRAGGGAARLSVVGPVSREQTTSGLLRRLVDRAFDGSAGRLVARLVEDRSLSARDREEIRRLLETREGEAKPDRHGPGGRQS